MFEHSEQDAATNCSLHRTETLIRTCSCAIHINCTIHSLSVHSTRLSTYKSTCDSEVPPNEAPHTWYTTAADYKSMAESGWVMTVQPTALSTSQPVLTFNNSSKQHCHRRWVSYLRPPQGWNSPKWRSWYILLASSAIFYSSEFVTADCTGNAARTLTSAIHPKLILHSAYHHCHRRTLHLF